MKNIAFFLLLLTTGFFGCGQKPLTHTVTKEEVVMAQNASLYRKKPNILPAKGRLMMTKNELIFVPTPYFWVINMHGSDTTIIKLNSIEQLVTKRWFLIFPFRLDVKTEQKIYPFITVRREKLAKEIQQLKE